MGIRNFIHNWKRFLAESDSVGEYCTKCEVVAMDKSEHEDHTLVQFSRANATFPSRFLKPKSENKKEAQYFFSPETVTYITDVIDTMNISRDQFS